MITQPDKARNCRWVGYLKYISALDGRGGLVFSVVSAAREGAAGFCLAWFWWWGLGCWHGPYKNFLKK